MAQGIVVNPEQLEALRATFAHQAEAVRAVQSTLTSQVGNTVWQGHVADQFRNDWHQVYAPGLSRLEEALHAAGADVQTALQRALHADGQG